MKNATFREDYGFVHFEGNRVKNHYMALGLKSDPRSQSFTKTHNRLSIYYVIFCGIEVGWQIILSKEKLL